MNLKLYYTRHGKTEWNAQDLVCTRADIPLNDEGIAQAQALAEKVAALGEIDAIVASPMLRARQTAEIVAAAIQKPLAVDERLREWDYGDFEGVSRLDRETLNAAIQQFAWPLGDTGETLLRTAQRVYNALDDIKTTYAGQTVLVVAHGAVCRVIHTYFNSLSNEEYVEAFVSNCELRVGEF